MDDNHKLAQLHLVFGIAALSSDFPDEDQISLCEFQWRTSLDAIFMENTLPTLQCLTLATLYSLLKGDYKRLQQYKGVSVALAHRLGLHQSQKRFSFGALTMEMRKKVFWTMYTIDWSVLERDPTYTLTNMMQLFCSDSWSTGTTKRGRYPL
jgi:Fungal specific transcription factor domain